MRERRAVEIETERASGQSPHGACALPKCGHGTRNIESANAALARIAGDAATTDIALPLSGRQASARQNVSEIWMSNDEVEYRRDGITLTWAYCAKSEQPIQNDKKASCGANSEVALFC